MDTEQIKRITSEHEQLEIQAREILITHIQHMCNFFGVEYNNAFCSGVDKGLVDLDKTPFFSTTGRLPGKSYMDEYYKLAHWYQSLFGEIPAMHITCNFIMTFTTKTYTITWFKS